METDIRNEIIQNIKKLPTLPVIFEKILETIDDPHSSANILQETIKNDQSITAKVLNMANSAYYGYAKRVSDLSRAIVILGFDMVKNIALSVSVFNIFHETEKNNVFFDREQFWLHSIATGYLGKMIADKIQYFEPDKAFISCLLHDIGKVVLDSYFEEKYKLAVETAVVEKIPFRDAERAVIGFDHAEVGFLLGEKWNFPDELITAIHHHHQPNLSPLRHAPLTYLTYLANIICQEENIGKGGSILPITIDGKAFSVLSLKSSQEKQIRAEIQNMRSKLEVMLQAIH
jgi:putative nucleotidyltransferase with HDIG domain